MANSRVAWFSRVRTSSRVQAEPFRSRHFEGNLLAELRVNAEAEAAYRALVMDTRFEAGTLLVETLLGRDGAPAALLALERRAEGWAFSEVDPEGVPLPFDESLCRGCHAGALAAPVFGPARIVPERESKR
ncbi:MAG TPA: hypothetical protein VFQ35_06875 [Polyangiaceae bacterium]|nr:hypothetical protein [Polyangiaceae bacterium]